MRSDFPRQLFYLSEGKQCEGESLMLRNDPSSFKGNLSRYNLGFCVQATVFASTFTGNQS